jgi:hypothetical protein
MFRPLAAGMLVLAVAGCATRSPPPTPVAARPPAAQPQPRPAAPPAPVPTVAIPTEPGEAVWHLRAGLNVAALSCRGKGRESVAPGYARLLTRHKTLLANAYAAELKRHGKGLDRHQTQLYNRFAYQPRPDQFCRSAALVANEANALDSPGLARAAPKLLSRLGG